MALTLKKLFIKWLPVTLPITGSHALTLHSLRIMLLLTRKPNRVNELCSLSKAKNISKRIINTDKNHSFAFPQ